MQSDTVTVQFRTWYSNPQSWQVPGRFRGIVPDERARVTLPTDCLDSRLDGSKYMKGLVRHFGLQEYQQMLKLGKLNQQSMIAVGDGYVHCDRPVVYLSCGFHPINIEILLHEGWEHANDWERYTQSTRLLEGVHWWLEPQKHGTPLPLKVYTRTDAPPAIGPDSVPF